MHKDNPLVGNETTISFPRPGWHTFVAICAFLPITMGLTWGLIQISPPHYRTLIIPAAIIFASLSIWLLTHFWKYEKRVHILQSGNILQIFNQTNLIAQYEINDMECIVSKLTKLQGDFKYQLEIKKSGGRIIDLIKTENLNEGIFFRLRTWDNFAERIAKATNKMFIREIWREDFNGNLNPIALTEAPRSIKYQLIPFVPMLVLFVGALAWRTISVSKGLLLWGAMAVLTNINLSLLYVFKKRQEFGNLSKNNLILISFVFSMTVPYIIIYLLFIFILNGFSLANVF